MPVDYKLRSLRRLFGEGNFLRPTVSKSTNSAAAATSAGSDGRGKKEESNDFGADEKIGLPGLGSSSGAGSSNAGRNKGGIARPLFSETTPRAIKGKPVSGHLYSVYLYEKQKIKVYYGAMRDRHFRAYIERAKSRRCNTDVELLKILEMRLDTVLYRSGFVITPMQSRQWIFHGHVKVNDITTTSKRYELTPGDIIQIRNGFESHGYKTQLAAAEKRKEMDCGQSWILRESGGLNVNGMCPWMEIDRTGLSVAIVRYPTYEEMDALKHATLFPFIKDANLDPHAAMRSYR